MSDTERAFSINWPAIFASEAFRLGWRDRRAGLPPNAKVGDADSCYALGRLMSIEAKTCELPPQSAFYNMQMRMIVQQCPEMVKDICLSAMREAAQSGVKTLHVETGVGRVSLTGVTVNDDQGGQQ